VPEHPGARSRLLWGRLPRRQYPSHCRIQQRDEPLPPPRGCVAPSNPHADGSRAVELPSPQSRSCGCTRARMGCIVNRAGHPVFSSVHPHPGECNDDIQRNGPRVGRHA